MESVTRIAAMQKLFLFIFALGADWPHWRGPNRNDITSESSGWNAKAWPAKRVWNKRVGYGSTSPIIYKDRLYTAGWADNKDYIYCLNAATPSLRQIRQRRPGLIQRRHLNPGI